ncbi:MAG: acetylornithine/succinylornithine family transaminase [Lachnospiraceae bacterium]|nr:acetylornithine/succinylornithine family transaminase [Lachnospiraceae bacterium]
MKIKNYEPSYIEIYNKDREIILREKSLVAFSQNDMKIRAIGTDAETFQNMDDILIVSPLRHGMIADFTVAERMFKYWIWKTWGRPKMFSRPRIAVSAPEDMTVVERKALEDAMYCAGAKEVFISEDSSERFWDDVMKEDDKRRSLYDLFIVIIPEEKNYNYTENLKCIQKGKECDMIMQEYIDEAEKALLHTYNRYQVVFDKGEGVYLYDVEGKKYLDFVSGIAVFALGYQNREYNDALKSQIDKIIHTSNYYYNVPAIEAAKKLKEISGMDRVFFTNSGAEAIEGAIKAARKYAYLKDGKTDHEIIAMNHSFHGRTYGALSVTGNPHYREAFEPMIGNIRFADLNDFDSVMANVNEKTCAILFETIQGEGGLHPADEDFMKKVKKLCEERDILLILDEIQCGMGRTGYMYAWQRFGIKPDIMTTAKALGCGVPVGAFLMTEKVGANSLAAGDHGTTYGGNPLACAAICKVIELFEKEHILDNVKEVGAYLEAQLDKLVEEFDFIEERRGVGLMQGLVFSEPVRDIIAGAIENGLILINAGNNIIRFVPPLVITKQNVDEMIGILRKSLA